VNPDLWGATDEEIEQALRAADPMLLRGLMYQLTGDERLTATEVEQGRVGYVELAGLVERDLPVVLDITRGYLRKLRDEGPEEVSIGPMDRLRTSLSLSGGKEIPESQIPLWIEEMALDPWARSLEWRDEPPESALDEHFVLVIGAGLGGVSAAIQLKHAGIPFEVVEKNTGVGGTWYENRYPGARVDSPSRCYTHILGAKYDFPGPYATQEENEKYFHWLIEKYGVADHITLDTEVQSLTWDEDDEVWNVIANGPDGLCRRRADVVISAVGFLSRPNVPDIPGADQFNGPAFHTAKWPADFSSTDKRIGVIGTGCSGTQMIPVLAEMAKEVTVFQRTPQWLFEMPGYTGPFREEIVWLDRNLPFHKNFARFRSNWLFGPDVGAPMFDIDPEWTDPHTRSAVNKRMRDGRLAYIQEKFRDHPDLAEEMVPPHPPFSARPVLVDADYNFYDALLRDDVKLVRDGIERITQNGVLTEDGNEHRVDALVYATGFRANDFLWPMKVRGRSGVSLDERWAEDGARAFLGTMVPGFPNLFMLYGPNTNPFSLRVVNWEEMITRFILERVAEIVLGDKSAVEVTEEAYRSYNAELDEREALKMWSDGRAQNYFKNQFGRSAANSPFSATEMWSRLKYPDDSEFVSESSGDRGREPAGRDR
jgi:4-hydroxyacetophenone monooxygenase